MHRSLVLFTVLCVASPALAGRVIPPGGESGLRRALAAGGALPDGWRHESTDVQRDRVFLRFVRDTGGTCELLVEHPDAAGASARRAGSVAIDPSGAPPALVAAVIQRLSSVTTPVRWQAVDDTPPPPPPDRQAARADPDPYTGPRDQPSGAGNLAVFQLGRHVDHVLARGDVAEAHAAVLAFDASQLQSAASRGHLAVLLAAVGEADKAAALARQTVGTPASHLGRMVLEPDLDPASLIEGVSAADACRMVRDARAYKRLRRPKQAETLLRALAERHPTCTDASTELALALIEAERADDALAVITPALEANPGHPGLLMVRSNALRLLDRISDAIDIVEELVRGPDRLPGNMGMLLAMYLREARLNARIERWKTVASENPGDVVAAFMIGVLLHYENHFRASNAWLGPLLGVLEGEPRLYVYRAMNDYNLGRHAEARRLLEQGAALSVVDPDIYYCRAEITRDTERDLAAADLRRYLALTGATPHRNAEKQARVAEMLAELEACAAQSLPHCGGPWEHPREPLWRAGHGNLWPLLIALFGVGLAWTLRRRGLSL